MKVIVLASRKGGAGKTTVAAHVAVEAESKGAGPVAVLDADPMAGLAGWWNAREADTPVFTRVGEGGLHRTLDELSASGVNLLVIDTPPAATTAIGQIIAAADLVLVPVVPSPNDMRAIGETLDLVEQHGRPLVFVVNNASTNGRLTKEACVLLSQFGTVAPVVLRTRQDYRSSMSDGRTVTEADAKSRSSSEVSELWTYIAGRLAKGANRGAAAVA